MRKKFIHRILSEISLERVLGIIYLIFGALLLAYSHPQKTFSEDLLITDLMWLDAWSLAFFLALITYWKCSSSTCNKSLVSLLYLSLYLIVANNLILDGTFYYLYGYSGDQKFRQAMVLKFMTSFSLSDFYYKDLPAFYPPLYYYLQAIFARIFSIEVFKMAKIGQILIFAFFPVILYYFWRKIVSPVQAVIITFLSFLYCNYSNATQFFSPHTFLAYALFIPWWFIYVDPVKDQPKTAKYYITGGLIGALIFLTYFYVFAIGFFYILLKFISEKWLMSKSQIKWPDIKNAAIVLGLAAIFSAVYWLPLLISIITNGADRSPSGWYHIGYPGLSFQFLQFSFTGIVLFAGIIYLLRRLNRRLNRGLVLFVASVIMFHLVGSFSGAMGVSLKITKSTNIFFVQLAAPIIGLMLASFCRRDRVGRKKSFISIAVMCALLLLLLNNISGIARSDGAKRARTSVPTWNTNREEMKDRSGDVFLLGDPAVPSFYPIYSFLNTNEHYAHPASRYISRYLFLNHLQLIKDPYLFNIALHYNKFDRVDYFMPFKRDGKFVCQASLSNYPNRSYLKNLKFELSVVADSNCFSKQQGAHLYKVEDPKEQLDNLAMFDSVQSRLDSLKTLTTLRGLIGNLSIEGQRLAEKRLSADWSQWTEMIVPENGHKYSDRVTMLSGYIVEAADSLYFLFSYLSRADLKKAYKIYLHIFDSTGVMHNFDFVPAVSTSSWKKWDIIVCGRAVPKAYGDFDYAAGLFAKKIRLGQPHRGRWQSLLIPAVRE